MRETSDIVACQVVNEILERTKILHHENFRNFVFFVEKIKKTSDESNDTKVRDIRVI